MSSFRYDKAKQKYNKGLLGDLSAATLKVALLTSSYTPNQATHEFFSDLTNEVVGTGYTAGGATLASVAESLDTTNHLSKITATNVTWTNASITARYAVVYKSTGVAGTSPVLCLIDFGSDKTVTNLDFVLSWDSTYGVFYIQ